MTMLRGFVKLKKIQKSEKNSESDGWVKLQLRLFSLFWKFCMFFVFFVVVFLGFLEKKLT